MPASEALRGITGLLACPVCTGTLTLAGPALVCERRHSFDVARQGYVNLLGQAPPRNADTTAMCDARDRFLASGHYDPVREAVIHATGLAARLLEVGAGTAWYLAGVLDALPAALGLATDVSVAAVRRAARAHVRAAAVVADTWAGLPLQDGSVDAVLCVFAPRNGAEFARVLPRGGRAVVAAPGPEHLVELRTRLGLLGIGPDKPASIAGALGDDFQLFETQQVGRAMTLTDAEATRLVAMGPNAFHGVSGTIDGGDVTLDVTVTTFLRR